MAWIKDAYYRNELEVGGHQLCPYCKKGGEAKPNACKKHKYVWAEWFKKWFEQVRGTIFWRAP